MSSFAQMNLLSDQASLTAFLSFRAALPTSSLFRVCAAGTKQPGNEWRCYHRYLLQKCLSSNFFPLLRRWKVIWRLVCGAADRMDEHPVSLGRRLCFKAVWETAKGEEFISSSEQSRARTTTDHWEEFKRIISKELEDDSHRRDWGSQIPRRFWSDRGQIESAAKDTTSGSGLTSQKLVQLNQKSCSVLCTQIVFFLT